MTARRSHGDGGLYWSESRQRWIAEITIGYSPSGKRLTRKASGKTKTEAKNKLKEIIRDHDDGLTVAVNSGTVADAVNDWLAYGLASQGKSTIDKITCLCQIHVIPALGARRLRELTAEDVDRWLAAKARVLSTRTLQDIRSFLCRAIDRAMARDKVKRNVVHLCAVPKGLPGRPSKALTLDQAKAVLAAAEGRDVYPYIVVSLLTGARTEELRALTWNHVDLGGSPDDHSPIPPHIEVWHSVRENGDTKTRKSRRTLALPLRCVLALRAHRDRQTRIREKAGQSWDPSGLVFATRFGTSLSAGNVRRSLRPVVAMAGLDPLAWTPRELRHSFVSLLSDRGVSLEAIADFCGHAGTTVTEKVYRHQIRPVLLNGAVTMDKVFPMPTDPDEVDDVDGVRDDEPTDEGCGSGSDTP